MAEKYPDFFNVLIPVGSDDLPSDSVIDLWDINNVHLFFAMGKRDEFNDYEGAVVPRSDMWGKGITTEAMIKILE